MPKSSSKPPQIYIGIMSGTSLDGADVAIADFEASNPKLLFAHTYELPTALRNDIAALCQPGDNEIQRMGELDAQLGDFFADCVNQALQSAELDKAMISAIGSHGQTIRHSPAGNTPFTLQIGDGNRIAYNSGIATVADFRRADMAAGGQGAPLVS
jgi:anhydro-N-acetylmuramic acid kinase